jgi:hypothetical protein
MFSFEEDAELVRDREDLIAVLRMRFGKISPEMIDHIYELNDLDTLERLILAAANASELAIFQEELEAGEGSFRLVGDRFNPLLDQIERGE